MPLHRLVLFFLMVVICLPAIAGVRSDYPPKPTTVQGWRKAAAEDLAAIHTLLKENHPAMVVDKGGESFKAWIDKGYEQAKRQIPDIRGEWDYYFLITHYVGGFRDAHIGINRHSDLPEPEIQRWPGIVLAYANGRYVVHSTAPWLADRAPPLGAELVTCDGHSVDALARARLDLYWENMDLERGAYQGAWQLLMDVGNGFAPQPRTCLFRTPAGIRSYPLEYRKPVTEDDLSNRVSATAPATSSPLGVTNPLPGVWWIALPSMRPAKADWDALITDVESHLADIRAAHQVVIDLRGNLGGNDMIPFHLASLLWGRDFLLSHEHKTPRVIYRATPLIIRKYKKLEEKSLLLDSTIARITPPLQRALNEGKSKLIFNSSQSNLDDARPDNRMNGQVVLLTDHNCVSACLDGMDMMLPLPNTVQAGWETWADTIFGAVIHKSLPSRRWSLYFSVNAAVDRCRGNNIPYRPLPGFRFSGDIMDTAAIQAWVQHLPATPADWGATGPGCPRSQPQPVHPPPMAIMD
ncbi:S41 family peptidase [Nitrospirillum amazonense]|uniref:S41 family peptidase n=1 Tax=Nitrospirillum amazonense TaxID=28077 RepID=UPI0024128190|nr:S41 family peptidase [Nitrospirillum amazonense]MDG3441099.1 S41 family peptidase [Nitrospirillum amazonense]